MGRMIGKYRVVSRRGRGGTGTVGQAVDEMLEARTGTQMVHTR